MPTMYELWVIDEAHLPREKHGTDDECYQEIVDGVRRHGGLWFQIEAQPLAFIKALQAVDREALGNHNFLPVLSYNHSPHDILGPNPSSPDLGYFNPERAHDLHRVMQRIPALIEAALAKDALVDQVYRAFKGTAREAASTRRAIAVLHGV